MPAWFVVTDFSTLVLIFLKMMVTSGITLPVASRTVPLMDAVESCASAKGATAQIKISRSNSAAQPSNTRILDCDMVPVPFLVMELYAQKSGATISSKLYGVNRKYSFVIKGLALSGLRIKHPLRREAYCR